jgi:hypothetical protein
MHTNYQLEHPKGIDHLEELDLHRMSCECVVWIHLAEARVRVGSSENDNELSGSMKCGEVFDKSREHELFKTDCGLWR